MNTQPSPANRISLSRYVNESPPPWSQLLTAHEVARLVRRPALVVCSLALIGRFPKKRRYQGRRVGWLKSDIVEWMAGDLSVVEVPPRRCARKRPLQPCLPLECREPCQITRRASGVRQGPVHG